MELIDIKFDQVNEWLLQRKKLKNTWGQQLRGIYARQKELVQSLKSSELKNCLEEESSGYLQAKSTYNKLLNSSEAEKGKTILGNWSSQVLYDWSKLVKLYEKDNLHIADCAKQLVQLGSYEIPAFKSQIKSCEKQLKDFIYREQSIKESIQKQQKLFSDNCKKHQVSGQKIRQELKAKTRELPEIYLRIFFALKEDSIKSLIALYKKVTEQNHGSSVHLRTIESLQNYQQTQELESIKDKYSPPVSLEEEVQELQVEPEGDWVIETVESGEQTQYHELPLESREVRAALLNELVELEGFADIQEQYQNAVKPIIGLFKDTQELILLHEQPQALERIASKLESCQTERLHNELKELKKNEEASRAYAKETHSQISHQTKIAQQLIEEIEPSISKVFPNVSIKVVGEIKRDIKNFK